MTSQQKFGGKWTQDKLKRLEGYLNAYMTIFRKYPYFQTVYIDAFAGTGRVNTKSTKVSSPQRGSETAEPETGDVIELLKGSTRVALEVSPPFKKYGSATFCL